MKNLTRVILSAVVMCSLLCGCGNSGAGAGRPASSNANSERLGLSPSNPNSEEIPSVDEQDPLLFWPQEQMGDLPDPGGVILSVTATEGGGANVAFEGIPFEEAESYIQKILNLGYNTQAEGGDDQGGLLFSAVKDGYE